MISKEHTPRIIDVDESDSIGNKSKNYYKDYAQAVYTKLNLSVLPAIKHHIKHHFQTQSDEKHRPVSIYVLNR